MYIRNSIDIVNERGFPRNYYNVGALDIFLQKESSQTKYDILINIQNWKLTA